MGPINFSCDTCGTAFNRKSSLIRHQKTAHGNERYHCSTCEVSFTRQDAHARHMKKQHKGQQVGGGRGIPNGNSDEEPMHTEQPKEDQTVEPEAAKDDNDCISEEEAINGNIKKITLSAVDQSKYDPMTFLKNKEEKINSILRDEVKRKLRIKFYLTMQVRLTKNKGKQVEVMEPFFHGRCHIVLKSEDINPAMKESMKKIFTSFLEFQREGSNWTVDKVMNVNIHIVKYKPLKGSSYIPLPAKLASKKAIINIQNNDNKCFMWSILAALYPSTKHPERVTKYLKYHDALDFTGISFPVRVADVPKFEKKNDISVNVFGYEKQEIYPIHLTKQRGLRHVDLLIVSRGETSHYYWINNFNRLMADQNDAKKQYHYCHYCLHGFTKKSLLDRHLPYCQIHGAQRTEMPLEEDKWLEYTDVSRQLKAPFVVYADFECILERRYGCQPDPNHSSTIRLAKHIPSGLLIR